MTESSVDDIKTPPTPDLLDDLGVPFDGSASVAKSAQPSAFDFTSRNAQFLDQVDHTRQRLVQDGEVLKDELFSGVPDPNGGRSLDWDPSAESPGALFAGLPPRYHSAAEQRRALGVGPVFEAALTKKADGYSGAFSPSAPV